MGFLLRFWIALLLFCAVSVDSYAAQSDSIGPSQRRPVEMLVSAVSSVAVNAAFTEILKNYVHEMRPDRSDNSSFPSRHTSWAFTASSIISRESYMYSPWWSIGSQVLATSIGIQRVRSRRHYGSDAVSGAVLGMGSTALSYWVVSKIFYSRTIPVSYNDFRPGIAVTSEALYSMDGEVCTGFGLVLRGQVPFSENWGAVLSLRSSSTPVKLDSGVYPLNSYGAAIGGMGHFRLPIHGIAFESTLQAGVSRLDRTQDYNSMRYVFEFDFDVALNWRITSNFAARATVGYRHMPCPGSSIVVGLSSVALF